MSNWCVWGLLYVVVLSCGASQAAAQVVTRIEPAPFTQAEKASFLKAHNEARQTVGVPPVEWSDELAKFAAEWLASQTEHMKGQVALGQFPNPGHRPREGTFQQRYGENVAIWGGSPGRVSTDPAHAVAQWLKEKAAFDKLNQTKPYVVGDENGQTDEQGRPVIVGHYTQVAWKNTKRIGAGKVIVEVADDKGHLKQRYLVLVCNYDPAGNMLGQKPH